MDFLRVSDSKCDKKTKNIFSSGTSEMMEIFPTKKNTFKLSSGSHGIGSFVLIKSHSLLETAAWCQVFSLQL